MDEKQLYKILKNREIYNLLDGDTPIYLLNGIIEFKMPYLSVQNICDMSEQFRFHIRENFDIKKLRRWQCLDKLLNFCIERSAVSDFFEYLFKIDRFRSVLKDYDAEDVEMFHKDIIDSVLQRINGILIFDNFEMIHAGNQYLVCKKSCVIELDVPKLKKMKSEYIGDVYSRALNDLRIGNYDSAITKSRTLLEEVFIYAIEKAGEQAKKNGDIKSLYRQVKTLYEMQVNAKSDERLKKMLSGLNIIVDAVAEMRNNESDAHGVGNNRISVNEHHARLVINSASTLADFLLSVVEKANKKVT